jgi:hypothetical protein
MDIRSPLTPSHGHRSQEAQSIAKPTRHEGIGNALRSAFDAGNWGLPEDMRQMLSKLDCSGR